MDIDDAGAIIGWEAGETGSGPSIPTAWYPNGDAVDLTTAIDSTSGWALRGVVAINALGEIVGTANAPGSDQGQAVLLRPTHGPKP